MTGKVKVGLLGAGFAQDFHMRCYREIPEAEIVAVASKTRERTIVFSEKWNIKTHYHGEESIERLCRNPEIDVVDICLPNFLHREAVEMATDNSKNVICEKPLARNVKEAEEMLLMVKKSSIIHCYAENQVFMPTISRAKKIVDKNGIGEVFWVRTREAHSGPHEDWFWKPELAGGGVLLDMGCHSIEASRYIINDKPTEISAWGATLVHDIEGEDNSLVLIKFEKGGLGQCENSWAAHGGLDLRFEVYGCEGAIFIDPTRETGIKCFSLSEVGYVIEKAEVEKGLLFPIMEEYRTYGYYNELKHFIRCIAEDSEPKETFNEGLLVNRILEAAYRSISSGRWEKI